MLEVVPLHIWFVLFGERYFCGNFNTNIFFCLFYSENDFSEHVYLIKQLSFVDSKCLNIFCHCDNDLVFLFCLYELKCFDSFV